MIAIVAGDERTRQGPLPVALCHAGFVPCEAGGPEAAAGELDARGPAGCVVVLDARALRGEGARWRELLSERAGVAAVIVARGEIPPELEDVAGAPHRILLHRPFDASAVVAAALRASASVPRRAQRSKGAASSSGSR